MNVAAVTPGAGFAQVAIVAPCCLQVAGGSLPVAGSLSFASVSARISALDCCGAAVPVPGGDAAPDPGADAPAGDGPIDFMDSVGFIDDALMARGCAGDPGDSAFHAPMPAASSTKTAATTSHGARSRPRRGWRRGGHPPNPSKPPVGGPAAPTPTPAPAAGAVGD